MHKGVVCVVANSQTSAPNIHLLYGVKAVILTSMMKDLRDKCLQYLSFIHVAELQLLHTLY